MEVEGERGRRERRRREERKGKEGTYIKDEAERERGKVRPTRTDSKMILYQRQRPDAASEKTPTLADLSHCHADKQFTAPPE